MRGLLYFPISWNVKSMGMNKMLLRTVMQKLVSFARTLFRKREQHNDDDFFDHPYAIL
jgi:hypothetical protein